MIEENNKKSDWSEREIGAFWTKESPKGKYLTGSVSVKGEKLRVVMFPNRHKNNDKAPDYRLYISKDFDSSAKEKEEDNKEIPESLV